MSLLEAGLPLVVENPQIYQWQIRGLENTSSWPQSLKVLEKVVESPEKIIEFTCVATGNFYHT